MRYEKKLNGMGENLCTGKGAHVNLEDARYCEICGQATEFFKNGLLEPYDVVQHEHENIREGMTVEEFTDLR